MRFRTLAAAGVALVLVGVVSPRGSNGSTSATIVRYVGVNGADSNSCTQSAPCRSFARAYQVASPGDVVEVAGGSYPGQRLTLDPSKTSPDDVVFVPAPGATPTFPVSNSLNFGSVSAWGAKHVELRGFKMSDVGVQCAQDVTLRAMDVGILNIISSQQVKVLGGDYGPWVDGVSHVAKQFGAPGCASSGQDPPTSDVLIDGALFHDYTISNISNHSECLQQDLGRLDRLTIRNSTFRNCTDFGILFNGNAHNVLIENNFFDEPMDPSAAGITSACNPNCARGGSSIRFSDKGGTNPSTNLKIRYNSSLGVLAFDPANAGVVVKGNIAPKGQCQSNVTFSFNVWSGVKCSRSDRMAALSSVFLNATSAPFDLRLRAGSAAIGAGDKADHPIRDIQDRLRPVAFPPDAGAWQREPALVVAGRAIGTARIGMQRDDVIEFYGPPRQRIAEKLADGSRVDVDRHRIRGGRLRVTYRRERVVAISTTSPFYQTRKGLGPGHAMRARANDDWTCRPVGAPKGRARLYLRPTRAKAPVVAELVVVAARFLPPCATAPTKK